MRDYKVITTIFDIPLSDVESDFLRGTVIQKLSDKPENTLAHNHLDRQGTLRYSYPLVQYKSISGRAAIVCLAEGTHIIEELISKCDFSFVIGKRHVEARIKELSPVLFTPQTSESGFFYRLTRWQALNSENYKIYKELVVLTDKIVFLEKILTGHILALYNGLGINIDIRIECSLTQLSPSYTGTYKGITTTLFDVGFVTNVSLPENCGLGKGASIGFGIIHNIK